MKMIIDTKGISETGIYVEGHFNGFPDWSFDAEIAHQADPGSDCWIGGFGRVTSVTLIHKGRPYYQCPEDDYDNRGISVSAEMEAMGQLIGDTFNNVLTSVQ